MSNQFDGVDGTKCAHGDVVPKDGDDGLWCRHCGLKIFAREKRPCRDCRHFIGDDKPCKIIMLGDVVRDDGHALYRIKNRTCFVEKPSLKKVGLKIAVNGMKGLNRAMRELNKNK